MAGQRVTTPGGLRLTPSLGKPLGVASVWTHDAMRRLEHMSTTISLDIRGIHELYDRRQWYVDTGSAAVVQIGRQPFFGY